VLLATYPLLVHTTQRGLHNSECNKFKWNASSVHRMSCHGTQPKPFRLKSTAENLFVVLPQY